MKLNNEQFVKLWVTASNQGKGARWIAELSGLSAQSVHARSYALRKKGVNLPKLTRPQVKRTPRKLDVNMLNAIIESESKAL